MTWHTEAACHGKIHIMYPAGEKAADYAQAKAICATCPVTVECLQAGIDEPYGTWGGLDPAEREQLRNRRYPNRTRIRIDTIRNCEQCQTPVHMHHQRQRYCEKCQPYVNQQREKKRRALSRPKRKAQ